MKKRIEYECLTIGKEFPRDPHYRIKYCKTYRNKNGCKCWKTLFIDKKYDTQPECLKALMIISSKRKLFYLTDDIRNGSRVTSKQIGFLKTYKAFVA